MGLGDIRSGLTTLAAGASYNIQPSGEHWGIHNVRASPNTVTFTLAITDGTHTVTFDSFPGGTVWANAKYYLTNSVYLAITNTSGSTSGVVGYDGVLGYAPGTLYSVQSAVASVAASGTYDIKPTGTQEWTVRNIFYSSDVDLIFTDGTNPITDNSAINAMYPKLWAKTEYHVNAFRWLRLSNRSASNAITVAYQALLSHL